MAKEKNSKNSNIKKNNKKENKINNKKSKLDQKKINNTKVEQKKIKNTKVEQKKVDKTKIIKQEKNNENYFSTTEVIVLIIMTVIVSLIIGSLVTYNLNKEQSYNNDKYLKKFVKNYKYVLDNYYKDVNKEELINGAIKGMVNTLDDGYSYVIEENESDNFNIQLEGEYKGIGVEIINLEDGRVSVYNVFEDSPADKAGLKKDDIIKKVDDMECTGVSTKDVSNYIRKNEKDEFKIIIERDEEEKELNLKKESVVIKSVTSKVFNKNGKKIGYIQMSLFSNVAVKQFENELKDLEKENIDSLIIDVRDNSGGHLTTATKIISLFLNSDHIMYQTNTRGKIKKYYSTGNKTKKYPIVILQNHNSASASEMLSAALKEEYKATVVGETSYGKGTVQELSNLDDKTEYKITTKTWLTPKGNSINGKGVKPDVKIPLNEEYRNNPIEEKDNQLQEALDVASKK